MAVLDRVVAGRRILKENDRMSRLTEAREVATFALVQSRWDEAYGRAVWAARQTDRVRLLTDLQLELILASEEDVWELLVENSEGALDAVRRQLGWCVDSLTRDTEGQAAAASLHVLLQVPTMIAEMMEDWGEWASAVTRGGFGEARRQSILATVYDDDVVARFTSPLPVRLPGRVRARGVFWDPVRAVNGRARVLSVALMNSLQQASIASMNELLDA